jgi:hypothetical protein
LTAFLAVREPGHRRPLATILTGSYISLALLVDSLIYEPQVEDELYADASRLIRLTAALLVLVAFLSLPRHPDVELHGENRTPVDREGTCSILEFLTFSWSRRWLSPEIASQLRLEDLPAVGLGTRATTLAHRHTQCAGARKASLKTTLFRTHLGALATHWSVTVLQSVAGTAPQYVRYLLFRHLSSRCQSGGSGNSASASFFSLSSFDSTALGLSLALGFAELAGYWAVAFGNWVRGSRLDIPISTTLVSLVYRKALRLPCFGSFGDIGEKKLKDETAPSRSILRQVCIDWCVLY